MFIELIDFRENSLGPQKISNKLFGTNTTFSQKKFDVLYFFKFQETLKSLNCIYSISEK